RDIDRAQASRHEARDFVSAGVFAFEALAVAGTREAEHGYVVPGADFLEQVEVATRRPERGRARRRMTHHQYAHAAVPTGWSRPLLETVRYRSIRRKARTDGSCLAATTSYARRPMRAARPESDSSAKIASARPSGSAGGTRRPLSPFTRISGTPPA